jgi:hypothetical protein
MPSWNELTEELSRIDGPAKQDWVIIKQNEFINKISSLRQNRNVIFYSSAFLQKPNAPGFAISISPEDINGVMAVMRGMDWSKGLTLILHTPGGITNAAETIGEYLLSKFSDIEVIIPTYAMSAGTMLSFTANKIIMGRQSQLGPIDSQMPITGRYVSAQSIAEQFKLAKSEISRDVKQAHVWLPILQSLGPALLIEAQHAIKYGEDIAARWLEKRMFSSLSRYKSKRKSRSVAKYFNKNHHSHGRRIDREEARTQNLVIEDLESDQNLQDAVLTLYHLVTILYENSPATKLLLSNYGKSWVKNIFS